MHLQGIFGWHVTADKWISVSSSASPGQANDMSRIQTGLFIALISVQISAIISHFVCYLMGSLESPAVIRGVT